MNTNITAGQTYRDNHKGRTHRTFTIQSFDGDGPDAIAYVKSNQSDRLTQIKLSRLESKAYSLVDNQNN